MEIGRLGREEIVGEIHLAVAHGCVVELEIGGIGETEREREIRERRSGSRLRRWNANAARVEVRRREKGRVCELQGIR